MMVLKDIKPSDSGTIELTGVNAWGQTVRFDPFVSCDLKWYEAHKIIGGSVGFVPEVCGDTYLIKEGFKIL